MFNLFKTKKITIPLDNAQSVKKLDFWTIEWKSLNHNFSNYGNYVTHHKVFIIEKDADEFVKQLEESAKFIKTAIRVQKQKN